MPDLSELTTRPSTPPRCRLRDLEQWLTRGGHAVRLAPEGLSGLAERIDTTEISGVCLSSQRVHPGDLYAALPGTRAHGASYADQAVAAGAAAVLTDPAGAGLIEASGLEVPILIVEHPRQLLGALSATVYGRPAEAMRMIGVTGTQGKTTTTRLLEVALSQAGVKAAVVGTVGTRISGRDVKTSLTTPEAPDLQALFAVMREQAVDTCAMEVSSHALVLGRVDGVRFDVAVFLNLGRDHLDFHSDVEDYFAAKAALFTSRHTRLALVNIDDEWGRRLLAQREPESGVVWRTFSPSGGDAEWRALDIKARPDGSSFTVAGPQGQQVSRVEVGLAGDFNVANALAALASAAEAGHPLESLAAGLTEATRAGGGGVPGRLERVDAGQPFEVVVDYAHKPDAVEAAIGALRPLTAGRVIVVLGAGGDRDRGKRPVMGEIAARLGDVLVVTDDNPRTEPAHAIRAEVLAGARAVDGADIREVADRGAAIAAALTMASAGDIVLIAGKGHETGQEINGVVHDFDDRAVARAELARRGWSES